MEERATSSVPNILVYGLGLLISEASAVLIGSNIHASSPKIDLARHQAEELSHVTTIKEPGLSRPPARLLAGD